MQKRRGCHNGRPVLSYGKHRKEVKKIIELCNRLLHNSCGMLELICYSAIDSEQTIILFNFDTTSICVDGNTCAYR